MTVRAGVPGARLIIAPHEPTPAHLAPIETWAARAGLSIARLGDAAAPSADVVLVDRVGVLGQLYALADAAFVGGGFHDAGLHSVLEPAAFGAPVLFGPRHLTSRDAGLLLLRGGGATAASDAAIARRLKSWLGDPTARRDAGDSARALVRSGLGAARRSFELVERLLR
jgi:3-deoxy-D-manno-octulosonic-acid transferase